MNLPVFHCPPDCGLCCKKLLVEVDPLDVLREPRIAAECVHLDGNGKLTPLQSKWSIACANPCAFLGEDNRCGIYATRPNVCVIFPAGGDKCRELRDSHGLPPLVGEVAVTMQDKLNAELAAMSEDELE